MLSQIKGEEGMHDVYGIRSRSGAIDNLNRSRSMKWHFLCALIALAAILTIVSEASVTNMDELIAQNQAITPL